MIKGFGGWIKIKNLPLDLWQRSTFEAIGDHFGGLVDMATKTLNLINCSESRILVNKIICGFVPLTIEVSNKNLSYFLIYANFMLKFELYLACDNVGEYFSEAFNSYLCKHGIILFFWNEFFILLII